MSYMPPKVWTPNDMGTKFDSINRPTAGARYEKTLPKGDKPYQLYSLNTPNGKKVNIILEELKALGLLDYDAFKINILDGEQFGSGFVAINPNAKIPALVDNTADTPISVFESGAILLYLAQKYGKFLPKKIQPTTPKCSLGLCGKWGQPLLLVVVLGIFMPMLLHPLSTPLTVMPWKPNANLMCWISIYQNVNIWQVSTVLLTWQFIHGMGLWCWVIYILVKMIMPNMTHQNFWGCMSINMSYVGQQP